MISSKPTRWTLAMSGTPGAVASDLHEVRYTEPSARAPAYPNYPELALALTCDSLPWGGRLPRKMAENPRCGSVAKLRRHLTRTAFECTYRRYSGRIVSCSAD